MTDPQSPNTPIREQAMRGDAKALVEAEWPDIGVEPLTLPRPRDIEETRARLNAAMCVQQPHVPNGTALVWRTDLLDDKHRRIRSEALADLRAATIESLQREAEAMADILQRISALGTVEELLTGSGPDFRDLTIAQRLEAMSTRRQERDQVVLDARQVLALNHKDRPDGE